MGVNVSDETSTLKSVIVGIGTSPGPKRGINAKSKQAIKNGTYPTEAILRRELGGLAAALQSAGVTVYRPRNLPDVNQVFTRDIGFVVGTTFVKGRMKVPARAREYDGIAHLINQIADTVVTPPGTVTLEGGDVVLHGNVIYVGLGGRTNKAAISFLRDLFPRHRVEPLQLRYKSNDPRVSVLHLDCVFQPVGTDQALFFGDGFVETPRAIFHSFPPANRIELTKDDLYHLCANVFSVAPDHIVSCAGFHRLNDILRDRGIRVTEIPYENVSILGGLLRCSTLPLERR